MMLGVARACVVLMVGAALSAVASCSGPTSESVPPLTRSQAMIYAEELLKESPLVDGVGPEYSAELTRLLPNVRHRLPDGRLYAVTHAVVVGEVTDVTRGHGYHASADRSQPLPFDSPKAAFSTIWVSVTPKKVLPPARAASASPAVRFEWTLRPRADFDTLRRGLLAQGTGVFFLEDEGEGAGATTYRLVRNGATTVMVGAQGELSAPFAGSDDNQQRLLGDGTTLAELMRAAARPVYEIPFRDPTWRPAR